MLKEFVVDTSGSYPKSNLENRYILVATYYYKKRVEAISSEEAAIIAADVILVKDFINDFGVLLELHSN